MLQKIILLIIFTILVSCSTTVDPKIKKAYRNNWNGDIVVEQKVYEADAFNMTLKAEEAFPDDKDVQGMIKEAN